MCFCWDLGGVEEFCRSGGWFWMFLLVGTDFLGFLVDLIMKWGSFPIYKTVLLRVLCFLTGFASVIKVCWKTHSLVDRADGVKFHLPAKSRPFHFCCTFTP